MKSSKKAVSKPSSKSAPKKDQAEKPSRSRVKVRTGVTAGSQPFMPG